MTSTDQSVKPDEEEGRGLLAASGVVSAGTFLSRISGLARDVSVAAIFGASGLTDAFFVAFKIPNYFRRLFAEGAFSQGFVPVLSEYHQKGLPTTLLIARSAGTLGATLLVLAILVAFFAPFVLTIFAPGFHSEPELAGVAAEMLRLTFFYLPLISLTALCAASLNVHGHFAVPALSPILLNLCLIGGAWLSDAFAQPIMALAWAVVAAGCCQLLAQTFPMARRRILVLPRVSFRDPGVRKVVRLMLPAILGASVSQINVMIDLLLASFLVSGSISWLYYSDRLVEFPLGVLGVAIATVILPSLSADYAGKDPEAFSRKMNWAIRLVILVGAPATLALILLAKPVLATLFLYGAITPHDIHQASLSLIAYAVGLPAFMLVKVLLPGYFARQDTRTPVRLALWALLINIVLNLLLILWLAHAGLALATSIATLANALMLFLGLRRSGVLKTAPGWWRFSLQLLPGLVLMGGFLWWFSRLPGDWMEMRLVAKVTWISGLCILGGMTYLAGISAAGMRVWRLIRAP